MTLATPGHTAGARHAACGSGVALLLLGFASAGAGSDPARTIRLEVPVVRQQPERCGPAALRRV